MTVEERLTKLELRDERREAEHTRVLDEYQEMLKSRDKLRHDWEQELEVLKTAFDQRIGEFAGSGAEDAPWDPDLRRAVREVITSVIDLIVRAHELGREWTVEWTVAQLRKESELREKVAEHDHQFHLKVCDRLELLEAIAEGRAFVRK